MSEADIAQLLRELPAYPMGISNDSPLRLSLAGNHEKTALLRHEGQWLQPIGSTPTTHILKLPIGRTPEGFDLRSSVENEWLCLRLLSAMGFPVPDAEMARFEDKLCLVVTRFDRQAHGTGILRLPHEDFCQATGTPSALKYESDGGPGIKACLSLLGGSNQPKEDRDLFFKALVAYWALCAIDGHAKNFSLAILPMGRFRLAPLYDVVSAYPILGHGVGKLPTQKATMAMACWGKNRHYHWERIQRRHWLHTAKDCGITNGDKLLDEVSSRASIAVEAVAKILPADFPTNVLESVFEGLLRACRGLAG